MSRRVIGWVVLSVLAALALGGVGIYLYVTKVQPFKAGARRALEAYVDARRRGVTPDVPVLFTGTENARVDRLLASSTSLDVEVGNWRMGSNGDWVCFEGSIQTPDGRSPLVAALTPDGDVWRIGVLDSRPGCECSSDEDRVVDCPGRAR